MVGVHECTNDIPTWYLVDRPPNIPCRDLTGGVQRVVSYGVSFLAMTRACEADLKVSGLGLLITVEGRLFHSLTIRGKNEFAFKRQFWSGEFVDCVRVWLALLWV